MSDRVIDNRVDVRQEAMKEMRTGLAKQTTCDEEEMLKLWKGFYYCMWMSDKPRVQEELSRTLASTLHMFQPKVAMMYYDCFLQTMCIEFNGIDQYRKDKYYMLIRRVVEAAFVYLRAHKWDVSIAQDISAVHSKVFKQVTLDGRIVAMFLSEIYFTSFARCFEQDCLFKWLIPKEAIVYSELEQAHIYIDTTVNDLPNDLYMSSQSYMEPCTFEAFKVLYFPLLSLLQVTGDKGVKNNVKNYVFQPYIDVLTRLLEHIEALENKNDEDEDAEEIAPANNPLDALTSTFVAVIPEFISWLDKNMNQTNIPIHALKPLVFFKEQLIALKDMLIAAGVIEEKKEVKKPVAKKATTPAKKEVVTKKATTPAKKVAAPVKKVVEIIESESESEEEIIAAPVAKKQKKATTAPAPIKNINPSKAKHTQQGTVSKLASSNVFTPHDIPLGAEKKQKKRPAPYKF